VADVSVGKGRCWIATRIRVLTELNTDATEHLEELAFVDVIGLHEEANLRLGQEHDQIGFGSFKLILRAPLSHSG
jgi:hypothetical protein